MSLPFDAELELIDQVEDLDDEYTEEEYIQAANDVLNNQVETADENSAGLNAQHQPPLETADNSDKQFAGRQLVWVDPRSLHEHAQNAELFGANRGENVADLIKSLEATGFDASRPIRAVRRADGTLVIIDGHRRAKAAIEINIALVPVLVDEQLAEKNEREEMIHSNLVRNRRHSSVGIGTSVRLIQKLKPRDVKIGRPSKSSDTKRLAQTSQPFDAEEAQEKSKRDYYAALLGVSVRKYRQAKYVLEQGTKEEKGELDTGPRALNAIYNAVYARKHPAPPQLGDAVLPKSLAAQARVAVRATVRLLELLGYSISDETDVSAELEQLDVTAKNEVNGAESGITADAAKQLIVKIADLISLTNQASF